MSKEKLKPLTESEVKHLRSMRQLKGNSAYLEKNGKFFVINEKNEITESQPLMG